MKKELTEKQQDFLQNLISSNGDPREAAEKRVMLNIIK